MESKHGNTGESVRVVAADRSSADVDRERPRLREAVKFLARAEACLRYGRRQEGEEALICVENAARLILEEAGKGEAAD